MNSDFFNTPSVSEAGRRQEQTYLHLPGTMIICTPPPPSLSPSSLPALAKRRRRVFVHAAHACTHIHASLIVTVKQTFASPPNHAAPFQGDRIVKAVPMRRLGDPAELDGLLLMLASERTSSYMTGSVLTLDGGIMLSNL